MPRFPVSALLLFSTLVACGPVSPYRDPPPNPAPGVAPPPPGHPDLAVEVPADPREGLLAHGVGMMLEQKHIRQMRIDDRVSVMAFDEFLERLDRGKLFLLQSDVERLARFRDQIDDQMHAGDLVVAREGVARLRQRQVVVATIVADILARPFDFNAQESWETDGEKRTFAATEADLRDRWRKLLKLQALQRVAQMADTLEALNKGETTDPEAKKALERAAKKIPATEEARWERARTDLQASYQGRFKRLTDADPLQPAETLLNAVTSVYDPHTTYLAPAEVENFDIEMSGSLEGIGAVLGEDDHYIAVREIVPGGASWRQGQLESGDLILSVAQDGQEPVDVADMPIDKVVRMIRGRKGTTVVLTVKKPDDSVRVISIVRDVVQIEESYAKGAVLDLGPNDDPVGYVYLPGFYGAAHGSKTERNATDDVRKILDLFRKRRLDAVVVDLRGNGGGLLGHARDIAGLLIEDGPVVQTQYSDGEREILVDEDPTVAFDGLVVVMVDRFSASASEILAAALQDYKRAVIVGTGPTHGKGSVQVLIDLDRLRRGPGDPLGLLKLTIQQYFRVTGSSTQRQGVTPDIVLPDPMAYLETGERFLDHSLEPGRVPALPFEPWSKSTWSIPTLTAKSRARVQQNRTFELIAARSALLERRRDETVVPLERGQWMARRAQDEASLDAVDPKTDEGKPRFEATPLEYDGTKTPARSNGADPNVKWKEQLTHDPWLEETLHIVGDMRRG